jgi:hypothetical protein
MLSLISRELKDNIFYFILPICFAAASITFIVLMVMEKVVNDLPVGIPEVIYFAFYTYIPFAGIVAAAFGASQMYTDKSKKISSFLITLATTRGQILTAKVTTGLLWILTALLPIAATVAALLKIFPALVPVDSEPILWLFCITFLLYTGCYVTGLLLGWTANKVIPSFGCLIVTAVLISVVIIKGYSISALIILLLFTLAAMTRTTQKFLTTPL